MPIKKNKKNRSLLFGVVCISSFLLIFFVKLLYEFEFFWYFSEEKKTFDLLFLAFEYSLLIVGYSLIFKSHKFINTLLFFVFLFYSFLSFNSEKADYIDKINISESTVALLIPYNMGAFSSQSFINLEFFHNKFFYFKVVKIKTYENYFSGNFIAIKDGLLVIQLTKYQSTNYSKESVKIKRYIFNT